jgi:formamidopyrimidine-DNA glycosylase
MSDKNKSLRSGAGYLQIDHTNSPGISAEDAAKLPGAMMAPGGQILERDIAMCSHCQRGIVLQPLRVRARGYCPKCNHYVCDG